MNAFPLHRIGRLFIAGATASLALLAVWMLQAPPDHQVLQQDTVWSSPSEPLVISKLVVVPSGVTLTISAGTTVYFRPRAGLSVAGCLNVEGAADRTVRLAGHPASTRLWAGISFVDSPQANRLQYVQLEGAGSEGPVLRLERSELTVEHVLFSGAECGTVFAADSSLVLRQSVIESVGNHEVIRANRIPQGGQFLVEDNVFAGAGRDVVDMEHCRSSGATPRFVGNVFLGGGEDGLDLDECDAWVEGNIFQNFHARKRGNESCAISCSVGSNVVITNNLFVNNDLAVMSKHDAHVDVLNNTFSGSRTVAVSFDKLDRGAGGGDVANCVFWGNGDSFSRDGRNKQFTVTNSGLPEAARWPNRGNVVSAPEFKDVASGGFQIRKDSLLAGRGAVIPQELLALAGHSLW